MSLVKGAHGGYEADALAGGPLFFEIAGEVGGAFKYDHLARLFAFWAAKPAVAPILQKKLYLCKLFCC